MTAIDSNAITSAVETGGTSLVRLEARAHRGATAVIYNDAGVLVAANHAVERDEGIHVVLADGKTLEATLVGRDPGTDVAVLKVDASGLPPAKWTDLSGIKVGTLVVTLGRPGRTVRASLGIIGALGDEYRTPAGGKLERYVQTDTAPQRGFSGGIVVDLQGRALGLNTSGIIRDANIVVSSATLKRTVDEIVAHGQIRRGYLGVGVYPVRLPSAIEQQVNSRVGVIVVAVEPGSPADKAGLVLGDVLVHIDGQPVGRPGDLSALLDDRSGKAIVSKILRGGTLQDITVTPGTRS